MAAQPRKVLELIFLELAYADDRLCTLASRECIIGNHKAVDWGGYLVDTLRTLAN